MYVRDTELRPMRARLREISGRDISVRNCEGGIEFRGNNVQFQCSIPPDGDGRVPKRLLFLCPRDSEFSVDREFFQVLGLDWALIIPMMKSSYRSVSGLLFCWEKSRRRGAGRTSDEHFCGQSELPVDR